MVNIWNPYQCMVTFNMSRSASLFESGIGRGIGFRDSNQDLLGFVQLVPARARERILDLAATQLAPAAPTTSTSRSPRGATTPSAPGFNDDPLWLVLGVAAYLKETGDATILDEPVPLRRRAGSAAPLLGAPGAVAAVHPGPPRPARAAAHRPGRLERLPEPQLLLGRAGRVVPDDGEHGRRRRRVGVHRRAVRARRPGARADRRAARPGRGGRQTTRPRPRRWPASIAEHGWDGEWFRRAYDIPAARRLGGE